MAMAAQERRRPHVERLELGSPAAYQVRILSGQFDVDQPFSVEKARVAIFNRRAVEAHDVMHLKWEARRQEAWVGKPGSLDERVDRWANGRARSITPILQTSPSGDLSEGLSLLGFNVAEPTAAPDTSDLQTRLKQYLAADFYTNYAGDRTQSVEALGDVFVSAAKGVTNRFSNADAISAMNKLKALKVVLEPILESDTFEKLVQTTEARIHAGLKDLKPEDGTVALEDVWKNQLQYFTDIPGHVVTAPTLTPTQTLPIPRSTRVREPRPRPTRVVTGLPVPVASAATPVGGEPVAVPDTRGSVPAVEPLRAVVNIESDPEHIVEKIKEGAGSTTEEDIVINMPADAMIGSGYLFSTQDGRVKVLEPGVIEPTGSDDAILIKGTRVFFKRGNADRNIKLDLLLKNNGTNFPAVEIVDTADGPYAEWDKQDAQEEFVAHLWPEFQAKANSDLVDIDPDWVVDGFEIADGGARFRIGFKKESPAVPPLAHNATIFPKPDEDDAVGSL
ncbi:MAG: hypothetical protein AAB532_01375 [Patescibacteria group bacterium]